MNVDWSPHLDSNAAIVGSRSGFVGPRSGLTYVHPTPADAVKLEQLEHDSFPTADNEDLYQKQELALLMAEWPEGNFVAFDNDHAVAMGLGVRRTFDFEAHTHSVQDIYSVADSSGHDPAGPWYYGTSIAVRPEFRRRGIGAELYALRKAVCRRDRLKGIVAGGVIPGFADHKHAMSADEYIDRVRAGDLYDSTLTFQLENGFEVRHALPDYMRDPEVDNYAALIVWHNPDQ